MADSGGLNILFFNILIPTSGPFFLRDPKTGSPPSGLFKSRK